MPEGIDPDTQSSLQSAAATVIDEQINPALRELLEFLESDYLPAARPPGIGALPVANRSTVVSPNISPPQS